MIAARPAPQKPGAAARRTAANVGSDMCTADVGSCTQSCLLVVAYWWCRSGGQFRLRGVQAGNSVTDDHSPVSCQISVLVFTHCRLHSVPVCLSVNLPGCDGMTVVSAGLATTLPFG